MEKSVLVDVNSAIERVRVQVAEVERRMEAQDVRVAEAARKQILWAQEQIALDEKHADLFVHAKDDLEEDNARKTLQYERAVDRADADRRQADEDRAELEEIEGAIAEFHKKLDVLPGKEANAASEVSLVRRKLDKLTARIAKAERGTSLKTDEITQELDVYAGVLGLEIEMGADESIVFRMTCIDTRDVAKEHCVTLRKTLADAPPGKERKLKYIVESITPALPTATVSALAETFSAKQEEEISSGENRVAAMSLLVSTRRAFRDMYEGERASE